MSGLQAARSSSQDPSSEDPPSQDPPSQDPPSPRAVARALLRWYDRHRRELPWRARRGETADPYKVWLSEIMLQQTTVVTVAPYFARFLDRFPTLAALAAADLQDVLRLWAGLGYYARARNLHACARLVAARGGFPAHEAELLALPGIGPYTAAAIAAIAFSARVLPVDGNVERVVARLYAVTDPLPGAGRAIRALAEGLAPARRPGDFAQAMMDLGAGVCTPSAPACPGCPLAAMCAGSRSGAPEALPRRTRKAAAALRRGAAFVAVRADGHVLVRRRPPTGLLAGMTEVPTTAWSEAFDTARATAAAPPFAMVVRWRRVPGVVSHRFTHFPLELAVFRARLPNGVAAPRGTRFMALEEVAGAAFPTVMRKVLAHASATPARVDPKRRRGGIVGD